MSTVQELVNSALRLIGVLDPGETPSASESNDSFAALNQVLLSWNAQALPIYQITKSNIAMTGASFYSLATRPVKIKAANVVTTATFSEGADLVDAATWAAFSDKAVSKPFAQVAYYEDGYPTGRLHLAPVPTSGGTVEIYSAKTARESLLEVRESFSLTGVSNYSIGLGGNFATERPAKLLGVSVTQNTSMSKAVEVVTADQYAAYDHKGQAGNFADVLYCDNGYPSATIYVAPKPTAGTLELYAYNALAAFASLAATLTLPDGYERGLRYALALEQAAEYGRALDANFLAQAEDAKQSIFGLNRAILGGPGEPPVNASQMKAAAAQAQAADAQTRKAA